VRARWQGEAPKNAADWQVAIRHEARRVEHRRTVARLKTERGHRVEIALDDIRALATLGETNCEYTGDELLEEIAAIARKATS
jgi:hypothetical protein